jgi:hypothetical protein
MDNDVSEINRLKREIAKCEKSKSKINNSTWKEIFPAVLKIINSSFEENRG